MTTSGFSYPGLDCLRSWGILNIYLLVCMSILSSDKKERVCALAEATNAHYITNLYVSCLSNKYLTGLHLRNKFNTKSTFQISLYLGNEGLSLYTALKNRITKWCEPKDCPVDNKTKDDRADLAVFSALYLSPLSNSSAKKSKPRPTEVWTVSVFLLWQNRIHLLISTLYCFFVECLHDPRMISEALIEMSCSLSDLLISDMPSASDLDKEDEQCVFLVVWEGLSSVVGCVECL